MRYLFLVLLVGCSTLPSPAPREVVKAALSSYEEAPNSLLSQIEGDVPETLMEIAADETEKRFFRSRALLALGNYPEERVFLFLSSWRFDREPFLALDALTVVAEHFSEEHPGFVEEKARLLQQKKSPIFKERLELLLLSSRGDGHPQQEQAAH